MEKFFKRKDIICRKFSYIFNRNGLECGKLTGNSVSSRRLSFFEYIPPFIYFILF